MTPTPPPLPPATSRACSHRQANEWSSATIAALNKPTTATSGFVDAAAGVDTRSHAAADNSGLGLGIESPSTSTPTSNSTSNIGRVLAEKHATQSDRLDESSITKPEHSTGLGTGAHSSSTTKGLAAAPVVAPYPSAHPPSDFASTSSPAAAGFVTGGGLATSSNVPATGTSGAHHAGLTRSELPGLKEKAGGDQNVLLTSTTTRTTTTVTGNENAKANKEKDDALTGREQAEAQLKTLGIDDVPVHGTTGIASGSNVGAREGAITPGKELPGGWGGEHNRDDVAGCPCLVLFFFLFIVLLLLLP